MSGWFDRRTREQWILLAVAGLLGPLTVWVAAGVRPPEPPPPAPPAKSIGAAGAAAVEFVRPEFAGYWSGPQELWSVEGAMRLPLTPLEPPEVPKPRLIAPPLWPAPPAPLYYRGAPARWSPGAEPPSLPAAWALPDARLQALADLPIAEPPARPDKRLERQFEHDSVVVGDKTFTGEILNIDVEGNVLIETPAASGRKVTFKREQIKDTQRRYTNLERFKLEQANLRKPEHRGDVRGRLALADQLHGWGMIPETISMLEEARALQPRDEALADRLLAIYEEAALYDAAAALLAERARRGGADRAKYGLRQGRLLERIGLSEAALAAYREVAGLSDEARLAQAWLEWRMGAPALARATAAGLAPSADLAVLLALAALTAPAKPEETPEARLAEVRRHADAAAARAGDLKPPSAAMLKMLDGATAIMKNEPAASVAFAEALDKDPELTAAWVNLALIHVLAGKTAPAKALLAQALRRDPASAEAAVAMGLALLAGKDAAGAAKEMDRALAIDPAQVYPHYFRGFQAADAKAAEEALSLVLRRRYEFAPAWLPAGLLALQRDRLLEAEALLRRAMSLDRSTAAVLPLVALLSRQGETEEALALLDSVTSGGPQDDAALLYVRGFLEYTGGERTADKRLPHARDTYFLPAAELGYEPAKRAAATITDWLSTQLIVDEGFDGADGMEVSGRWSTRTAPGVTARFAKGTVLFAGTQQDPGTSQVETEFDGGDLWRVEATIRLPHKVFTLAGVSLYHTRSAEDKWRGLHVAVRRQGGKSAFRVASATLAQMAGGALTGQDIPAVAAPAQSFEVRFQMMRDNLADKVQILVRVDGAAEWVPLGEPVGIGQVGGPMMVAIFAGGPPGEAFGAAVDDVRVYTRQAQK